MTLPFLASVGWPVLDRFRIGSKFAISPHGLFIAIGFLIGASLYTKIATRRGTSAETCNSIVFWSLIGAIVGARVGYVIAHTSEFSGPLEWLYIWKGGISLLGGITGATIANAVNIKRARYRSRFFEAADSLAPALALGIAIGRIGDLIIGDHLGKPTSWFLAWTYHGGTLSPPFQDLPAARICGRVPGPGMCATLQGGHAEAITRSGASLFDSSQRLIAQGVGVHQTALYDMLLAWVLFGVLWWFSRRDRREGTTALLFAVWYGSCRLLEDSLRIDKRFGPLTGSQWTALTVVLVSLGVLALLAVTKRPGSTTLSRKAPPAEPPSEGSGVAGEPAAADSA